MEKRQTKHLTLFILLFMPVILSGCLPFTGQYYAYRSTSVNTINVLAGQTTEVTTVDEEEVEIIPTAPPEAQPEPEEIEFEIWPELPGTNGWDILALAFGAAIIGSGFFLRRKLR